MDSIVSPALLALFIPAAFILIVSPGPVVMYIVTRSVEQGRTAGFASVLGAEIGNFLLVVAAALGLSALLLSSALAFDLVKYLGAAYLIYLGIRKLRSSDDLAEAAVQREPLRRIFLQSLVVAVLNPKTALFFFAFLPQFIDPARGNVPLQMLFLGLIMVIMATITDSLYALAAGTAGQWLRNSRTYRRFQRYVSGTVYIGLGLTAAFAGSNRK